MDDQNFDEQTALDWIQNVEKGSLRNTDIRPKLRSWIESVNPGRILEIGCGQGICSDDIDLNGRRYTGIEPSEVMVSRAKQLYLSENKNFLKANAYDLPFPAESFDAAFSVLVLHLLSDLDKSTYELSRVLRPGGHFLIITANPAAMNSWMGFYSEKTSNGKRFEGKMTFSSGAESNDVLYFHSLDEIKKTFLVQKLNVTHVESFRPDSEPDEKRLLLLIRGSKL